MVLSLLHLVKMVVLVATDWELRKHKSCLILIQASLCRAVSFPVFSGLSFYITVDLSPN